MWRIQFSRSSLLLLWFWAYFSCIIFTIIMLSYTCPFPKQIYLQNCFSLKICRLLGLFMFFQWLANVVHAPAVGMGSSPSWCAYLEQHRVWLYRRIRRPRGSRSIFTMISLFCSLIYILVFLERRDMFRLSVNLVSLILAQEFISPRSKYRA